MPVNDEDEMPMIEEELPGLDGGGSDFPSIGVLVVGGGIHAAGEAMGPIVSHPVVIGAAIGAISSGVGAAVTGGAVVTGAIEGAASGAVTGALSGDNK